jgi:hypothetical protein
VAGVVHAISIVWSQVDGPHPAQIATPARLRTAVTFPAAGTYVLRLTVDDGQLSGSDEVTVTVPAVVTKSRARPRSG